MDKSFLKVTTVLFSIVIFLGGIALASDYNTEPTSETYTGGPNEGVTATVETTSTGITKATVTGPNDKTLYVETDSSGSKYVAGPNGRVVQVEQDGSGNKGVYGPNGNSIHTDGESVTVSNQNMTKNATITKNDDGTVSATAKGYTDTKDGDTTTVTKYDGTTKSFDNTKKPSRSRRAKPTQ